MVSGMLSSKSSETRFQSLWCTLALLISLRLFSYFADTRLIVLVFKKLSKPTGQVSPVLNIRGTNFVPKLLGTASQPHLKPIEIYIVCFILILYIKIFPQTQFFQIQEDFNTLVYLCFFSARSSFEKTVFSRQKIKRRLEGLNLCPSLF